MTKENVFLISHIFYLNFSHVIKRLDHGGDTVDLPLSKSACGIPRPLSIEGVQFVGMEAYLFDWHKMPRANLPNPNHCVHFLVKLGFGVWLGGKID